MREPGDEETWVYRRDESLRAPRSFMVDQTAGGIPFLKAHGTLLFKAKASRPKDEADFGLCLPRLGSDERAWLATALARMHPGHAWLNALA